MVKLLEQCVKYIEKGIEICINHTYELSFGSGIVLVYLLGPWYMLYAFGVWVLATALDIGIGLLKAWSRGESDSAIFWRSLLKRALVAAIGLLLVLIIGGILAISTALNDSLEGILKRVALFPIGYWHLFTAQELYSLNEHLEDVRPDNRLSRAMKTAKEKAKRRFDEILDSILRKAVSYLHKNTSPKFSKLHLNRDES